MRDPVISVCIPTFNQGRFLGAALESVFGQTLQDFEIIVCDDASTDETREVVSAVRDPRLRYLRHGRNEGVAGSRNRCLTEARGRYIAWLDSDDVYHPTMLAVQTTVLDRHPNVGLVHGAFEVIDTDGRRLPDWPLPFGEDRVETGAEAFRELLLSNYITAPTVLVRREAHEKAGPYDDRVGRSSTDWHMWLKIALHGDVAYTASPVAQYRQHADTISRRTTGSGERLRCDVRTVKRVLSYGRGRLPEAKSLERQARAALAVKFLIHAGDAVSLGRWRAALQRTLEAGRLVGDLFRSATYRRLLEATAHRSEFAVYRAAKAVLSQLLRSLEGTRFGERIRSLCSDDPAWEETLRGIAVAVQRHVPPNAEIAVVDKWDPTLLHLSGRKGCHFPDRRLHPGGYPPDSDAAIAHLEELRRRGAQYLVFPSAAFWWLDHYPGFRRHLDSGGAREWADEQCIIYRLPATPAHSS